jgi:hypothetical protein
LTDSLKAKQKCPSLTTAAFGNHYLNLKSSDVWATAGLNAVRRGRSMRIRRSRRNRTKGPPLSVAAAPHNVGCCKWASGSFTPRAAPPVRGDRWEIARPRRTEVKTEFVSRETGGRKRRGNSVLTRAGGNGVVFGSSVSAWSVAGWARGKR